VSRIDRRRIQNSAAAPAAARRYVGETLVGLPNEVVDAAALMVSELATNCVAHTTGDFTVSVEQTPDRVRVDVADGGAGGVRVQDPAPTQVGGRGLQIVDRLSDSWGVRTRGDQDGTNVWFVLQTHPAV